jgi:hypothetical protein
MKSEQSNSPAEFSRLNLEKLDSLRTEIAILSAANAAFEVQVEGMARRIAELEKGILSWVDKASELERQRNMLQEDYDLCKKHNLALYADKWLSRGLRLQAERQRDIAVEALVDADGCFEAALAEGWIDALANGDLDRIRDLWGRRINGARHVIVAALSTIQGAE